MTAVAELARTTAAAVTDPELPMLTLADLGVLREVEAAGDRVMVTITPTYTGCPALAAMRADLTAALRDVGFADVEVRIALSPPWTTDAISDRGRALLREHGISPPGPAPARSGPIRLTLTRSPREVWCPQCGAPDATLVSEFGATACKALYRCGICAEPFEHVKEL